MADICSATCDASAAVLHHPMYALTRIYAVTVPFNSPTVKSIEARAAEEVAGI